jgi:GNAT superfamily N-acetyltransferase
MPEHPARHIQRFGPDDRDSLLAALDVSNAIRAADTPWQHPELPSRYEAELRHGWDGEPVTPYLLRVDGAPVGHGWISLTMRDNTHLAWLSAAVLPEHRRRGHGRALMRHLLAEAQAAGRTSVGIDGWESDAATGFAAAFAMTCASRAIQRRQHLAEVEPALVQKLYDEAATAADGYELVRVVGRTPRELLGDLVEVSAAINDAPTDDLDIEDEVMSQERLAAYEEAMLAQRNRLYRLVARHRETGALGGHTVVLVEEERPAYAHQHDTAVARTHRGHRLGLLLKAGMLLWLAEAEPQVETVDTWNAESNDHMIAVNELLGYRVMGRELQFQGTLADAISAG